jgi:hypothetical protein
MKRLLPFLLLAASGFSACEKEMPVSEVVYSITETSAAAPSYGIEYTNDQAGGTAVTSYNTSSYSSGKIKLRQGQFISMKVSCTDPTYELRCSIFINGNLWKTGSIEAPDGSITLSGDIPAE